MGTNGNSDDFDDISIDFFRQGDEGDGDDAFWADDDESEAGPRPDELADLAEDAAEAGSTGTQPLPTSADASHPSSVGDPSPATETSSQPAVPEQDRSIFSAPTMIVPGNAPLPADTAVPEPIEPAAPPPPAEAFLEETLFDAESEMFGDLDDIPGGEETHEVFDAPTQEAPRSLVEEILEREAAARVPAEPAATVEVEDDEDGIESSAEDFEGVIGVDPSLVMGRGEDAPAKDEEQAIASFDDLEEAPPPPVIPEVEHPAPAVLASEARQDPLESADNGHSEPLAPPPPPVPVAEPSDAGVGREVSTVEAAEAEQDLSSYSEPTGGADASSLPEDPSVPAAAGANPAIAAAALSSRPAESPDAAWAEALTRLVGLAARSDGADGDGYGAEAGRIAIEHAGSPEQAEQLLARAVASGLEHPALLTAYSIAVGALGDHPRLRDLLVRRGEDLTGTAGADLLQDAALVEHHQLGRVRDAVALLDRSLELASGEPTAQWFGLQLLRDLHSTAGDWAAAATVLEQMAGLAAAGEAAPFFMDLASIREEHLEDDAGALEAYLSALSDGSTNPQAVVGAERCASRAGDPTSLSILFGTLAARAEGADAGMWSARQARALANAGSVDEAIQCWSRALELEAPATLRLEALAALADQAQWDALHTALRREATHADGPGAGWARSWAANVAELHLKDLDAAIDDIRAVLKAVPQSTVARADLERMLIATDRVSEVVDYLESLIGQDTDPNRALNLYFRLGELRERALQDHRGARADYEKTLEISPAYLPALDGLERCARETGDWAVVASVHEQRASLQPSAPPSSGHHVAAALVYETRLDAPDKALKLFQEALDQAPCDPLALEGMIRVATATGDPSRVLDGLRAAAATTNDETRRVSLMYRMARVQELWLGDPDGARTTLRDCVEHSPAFRPAAARLLALARDAAAWEEVATLEAASAEAAPDPLAQVDHFVAAARAARRAGDPREAEYIQAALRVGPDHPAARAEADLRAILTGDLGVRQTLLLDSAATDKRAASYAVLADLCAAAGNRRMARGSGCIGSPWPRRPPLLP